MFTGLVESLGRVIGATGNSPRRLEVQCDIPPAEVRPGDSIAIDGCCLTVVAIGRGSYAFEAATETLARTTIGKLKVGDDFVHESIIGSMFKGRVEAAAEVAGKPAIIPSIAGWARVTGFNTIFIDERDPFVHGFVVT